MLAIHRVLESPLRLVVMPPAPAGNPPSLAWLAYNRLGFGPRPGDSDFGDDRNAFVQYVDSQLNYESLDDSACEAYVAALDRHDSLGLVMPPLDATPAQIKAYSGAYFARQNFAPDDELSYYLTTVTYARALLSRRQLFQVLADFWTNHFNTLPINVYKGWEDTNVIRQYALGHFRDLLGADAKSPVMLEYLSNAYNDGNSPNENYGRELMELHTLGSHNRIPGHPWFGRPNYTEDDVRTAALIFSGWTTLTSPNGEFAFNDTADYPTHDFSAKQLQLDHATPTYFFPAGGIQQGEQLLDILAAHPSTAYSISRKLCQRLISDAPETFCPGAVRAGMNTWLSTNGDLRAVVRAILLYVEPGHDFVSSWGQKLKRPFEFFISALRALNVTSYPPPLSSGDTYELWDQQFGLGQALFNWPPPTGYPDVQRAWWNTNQVFGRWSLGNLLVQRAFGEQGDDYPPVNAELDALIGNNGNPPSAVQVVDRLIGYCFGRFMDPMDRATLISFLGVGDPTAPITSGHARVRPVLGALLGSPYFQRR